MKKIFALSILAPALMALGPVGILHAAPPANVVDESNPEGRYIVQFRSFPGAAAAIRAAGGNPVLELAPQSAVAAYLPPQAIEALQRNPNVALIEQDPRRYPMAEMEPYGISSVQADLLSDTNAGNTTACIIDSGYDSSHPDLQTANLTGNHGNNTNTEPWNVDLCGHGTHVAGTIAALSNGAGVVGILPSGIVNLHIEKVFSGSSCAWSYASTLTAALERCKSKASSSMKVVVNMSLGGSTSSRTEDSAFASAYATGNVLSIAAAGNGGNSRNSYPASYNSVISVAAVDSTGTVASFSQYNSQVELAAPGVAVRSTVPVGSGTEAFLTVGATAYDASPMDGSPGGSVSGVLTDCGLGGATGTQCADAFGRVCVYQRGTYTFAEKVLHCQQGGGLAAVVYNNVAGSFSGTLNGTITTIPSMGISQADGQALLGQLGQPATAAALVNSNYAAWDGTSMATPHVAGVAALVWSHHPTKTNAQIRSALQSTALDKGASGRDVYYGFGIVQAKAAYDALASGGLSQLSATVMKPRNAPKYVKLNWTTTGTVTTVTVYRNNTGVATSSNTGTANDTPSAAGTYSYKVCAADNASICTGTVSVKF